MVRTQVSRQVQPGHLVDTRGPVRRTDPATAPAGPPPVAGVAGLLAGGGLRVVYQPVRELDSGVEVAYESLVRGPAGSALERPEELFAAARREHLLPELDWACRDLAVEGWRTRELRHPLSLFVNAEPAALLASAGDAAHWRSYRDVRCYTELTERALTADPARLFAAVDAIRGMDWGVALDDVGTDPASLALMPLVRPDVVKLDPSLIAGRVAPAGGRVLQSVLDWAGENGATVVAEGIETEAQLDLVRGLGIRLGQGYLLGRPGALPERAALPRRPVGLVDQPWHRFRSSAPFAIVNSRVESRRVGTATLHELARQLLVRAAALDPAPVVLLATRPDGLPRPVLDLLGPVAGRFPLVAAVSRADLGLTGVDTVLVDPSDPVAGEVDVVLVAPGFGATLTARPAGDGGDWEVVTSFDRSLSSAAAAALLTRVGTPAEPD